MNTTATEDTTAEPLADILPPEGVELIPMAVAAARAGVAECTLRRWANSGLIPMYRRLGRLYVAEPDLVAMIERRGQPVAVVPRVRPVTTRKVPGRATTAATAAAAG